MSVAAFITAQRAQHRVPTATSCRALGVSPAWYYKWRDGDPSPRRARRAALAAQVARLFAAYHGRYGSPRITAELRAAGWRVSENTVAALMREQGLRARPPRRRRHTTRPGRGRWRAPDLVGRRFAADGLNRRWYGDGTEIATGEGKLHLASVLDMGSRRIVGFALSEHHDAELAYAALAMAVAVRGGREVIAGVVLHTDQGSEYTARSFRTACARCGIPSRWAGPGRRWTTRSSSPGTPRWSSSCAGSSSSPPRPRPGPGSRPGSRSTTATGGTPHWACAARWTTNAPCASSPPEAA